MTVMVVVLLAAAGRALSYPVVQLPPGHVTLAHATTPQGPVAITLHRIRYVGHVSLCVSEVLQPRTQATQQCANYPIGPKSNQGIGNAPVWLVDGIAVCKKPGYQVRVGVMLRAHLTAWSRAHNGALTRIPTAHVPHAFGVAGDLLYTVITKTPGTLVLQDISGKTVYTAPIGLPCGA